VTQVSSPVSPSPDLSAGDGSPIASVWQRVEKVI
jgi:hypothetical protein